MRNATFLGQNQRRILAAIATLLAFVAPLFPGEEIIVKKWKILGPFMTSIREIDLDYLAPHGGEENIVPEDHQVFYSLQPNGGRLKWFDLEVEQPVVQVAFPNTDWKFLEVLYGSGRSSVEFMNTGYAYTELEFAAKTPALVFVQQVPTFWINGRRCDGEFYSSPFNGTPVVFDKGKNRILLKFRGQADGWFGFRIRVSDRPVDILEDLTTPDLLRGHPLGESYIGVPLVNGTEQWLRHLRLVVREDNRFRRTESPVPALAPLSIMKIPVRISQKEDVSDRDQEHRLQLDVLDGSKQIAAVEIPLRIKELGQPHKVTFLSEIDRSVQYYAIRYPKDFSPDRTYALILSLHGSGDEALLMAEAHDRKDWAFIVAPTDRRPWGFEYHGIGQLDFLEVLKLVESKFKIDQDRIYVTGASMGGHGSLYLGLIHASRFAAVAPEASFASSYIYIPSHLQRSSLYAVPEIRYFLDRASLDRHTPYFLENALHLPIILTHGAKDDNVSPLLARITQERLKALGYQVIYREIPDRPHFWFEPRTEEGEGRLWAVCIDHPDIMNFLQKQKRMRWPNRVHFKLADLSMNDELYWVKILEQERSFALSEVLAEIQDGKLTLKTKNVRRLRLHLPPELVGEPTIRVVWNGDVEEFPVPEDRTLQLGKADASPLKKSPALSGPLRNIFYQPSVLVYGTQGTQSETAILLNNARIFAKRFWRWANGRSQIVSDQDVNDELMKDHHLVLFGSPERNLITQKVSSRLPIRIESGRVVFHGQTLEEKDLGIALVYPNPLVPSRLMAIYAGTTAEMEKVVVKVQPIDRRMSYPDFVVLGREFSTYGWGGAKALGFFSPNWDLSNTDYYLEPGLTRAFPSLDSKERSQN